MEVTKQEASEVFEIQMVPTKVKVGETPKTYTLVMSEAEAALVKILMGSLVYNKYPDKPKTGKDILPIVFDMFNALDEAGVIKNDTAYRDVLSSGSQTVSINYMLESDFVKLINKARE